MCAECKGNSTGDDRDAIVLRLARYLFETQERLDPGRTDCEWEKLDSYDRAFYVECIWAILSRRMLLTRFFELPDRNFVIGGTITTEKPHGSTDY